MGGERGFFGSAIELAEEFYAGNYLVFRIAQNYSSKLYIVDANVAINLTVIELSSAPPAIAFTENGSRLGVVMQNFSGGGHGVSLQDAFQPIQDSFHMRALDQPQVLKELAQDVVETSGESRHPAIFYTQGGSRVFFIHWQLDDKWPTLEVSGWDVNTRQIIRHISYSSVHLDRFIYEAPDGYKNVYQVSQEYLAVLGFRKLDGYGPRNPFVTMIFSLWSDEQCPQTTLENTIVNVTISDGFLFIRENALRLWRSNVREEVVLGKIIYGDSRLSQCRASAMVLCEGGRQLIVHVGRLEVFERIESWMRMFWSERRRRTTTSGTFIIYFVGLTVFALLNSRRAVMPIPPVMSLLWNWPRLLPRWHEAQAFWNFWYPLTFQLKSKLQALTSCKGPKTREVPRPLWSLLTRLEG